MITVFIGTYNRLETLKRTIRSYNKFKTAHELVIVDNGSDNTECLRLLGRLEKTVKKIYSLPSCGSYAETTKNFNTAIKDQYKTSGGEWFAVTEADVCFELTSPRALDMYIKLAKHLKTAVGCHLRVDRQIPDCYPLRSRVLACETWMFYRSQMEWFKRIPYSNTQIDTTFHLFPRTKMFNHLKMNPMRVGPPYDAMHLDWYLNIFKQNRENQILIPDLGQLGSWGKAWIRDFWLWFQESPEHAFEMLIQQKRTNADLCNNSFMISWCYQYGHGVEKNREESEKWLCAAIPYPNDRYWALEEDWMKMVYNNDFSALGWE